MGCRHSLVDSPSILPPQVQVPSTPSTLFSMCIVRNVYLSFELECEKDTNKQKEAGIGQLKILYQNLVHPDLVKPISHSCLPIPKRSLAFIYLLIRWYQTFVNKILEKILDLTSIEPTAKLTIENVIESDWILCHIVFLLMSHACGFSLLAFILFIKPREHSLLGEASLYSWSPV